MRIWTHIFLIDLVISMDSSILQTLEASTPHPSSIVDGHQLPEVEQQKFRLHWGSCEL